MTRTLILGLTMLLVSSFAHAGPIALSTEFWPTGELDTTGFAASGPLLTTTAYPSTTRYQFADGVFTIDAGR